jgi:hypothetical protein
MSHMIGRYVIPTAIILAGALIAASIAMTNRWTISIDDGRLGAYRLDRWTGDATWCSGSYIELLGQPTRLDCQPSDWVSVQR